MIMEEIKQSVRYGSESICPSCVHNGVCRAIDNQPCVECDHYRVQDEWISVNDRLPEENGNYLCVKVLLGSCSSTITTLLFAKDLNKLRYVDFSDIQYIGKAGFYDYDSECGYYDVDGVTHWRPLPAPPDD